MLLKIYHNLFKSNLHLRAVFIFVDDTFAPASVGYDHTHSNPLIPDGYNVQPDFVVAGGTVRDVTSVGTQYAVWTGEVRNAYVQKGSLQNIFPDSKISRPEIAKVYLLKFMIQI